jgi:hypothetical protein
VGFRDRAERNWAARQRGAETPEGITVEAEGTLDFPAETVWDFLNSPESSVILHDEVTAAFWVPGTQEGEVGGVFCLLHHLPTGRRVGVLYEVAEIGPGLRTVTTCLSLVIPLRTEYQVTPIDGRTCVLRLALTSTVQPSQRLRVTDEYEKDIDRFFKRAHEALQQRRGGAE